MYLMPITVCDQVVMAHQGADYQGNELDDRCAGKKYEIAFVVGNC